jgi:ribosomal protein S27AE
MTLHDALCSATASQHVHAPYLRLPKCPKCGDMLLAPLMSEHVNATLVRNHWACEECGHTFRKSHTFEADDALAA